MNKPTSIEILAGERIALLTQHGKESVIAPRFLEALNAHVERVAGFDTDQLGTFTREVARAGNQLEAARQKARLGMQLAGLSRGMGSEGAFGPDPIAGLIPWDVELVIYIDDCLEIEVTAWASAPARHHHRSVTSVEDLDRFSDEAAFPGHHLVVRPNNEHDPMVRKGISTRRELHTAFQWAKAASTHGTVFVESDLRAYANPTRMRTIAAATDELIRRLCNACPMCAAPGFWLTERIPGLPCSCCGMPTRQPKAEKYACIKCSHAVVREDSTLVRADPGHCDYCNP